VEKILVEGSRVGVAAGGVKGEIFPFCLDFNLLHEPAQVDRSRQPLPGVDYQQISYAGLHLSQFIQQDAHYALLFMREIDPIDPALFHTQSGHFDIEYQVVPVGDCKIGAAPFCAGVRLIRQGQAAVVKQVISDLQFATQIQDTFRPACDADFLADLIAVGFDEGSEARGCIHPLQKRARKQVRMPFENISDQISLFRHTCIICCSMEYQPIGLVDVRLLGLYYCPKQKAGGEDMPKIIASDLTGKTCVVTGASAGIGEEVACQLGQLGAEVILGCRDTRRGNAALERLRQRVPKGQFELWWVDLSSQASIRTSSRSFAQAHPRLDVLVNNAGVWLDDQQRSVDGIELTWATNVLGYHLLAAELREPLRRAGRARIVNVASTLAYGLDLTDVEFVHRRYRGKDAYAQSKQADRMLTWVQARALAGDGITANTVHPGAVDTAMLRHSTPGFQGLPVELGADTITWLAASQEVEGVTGRFWRDRRSQPCEFANPDQEQALWSLCNRMTGLVSE
jgi:NAD(P)-dependent dehydrogenase (short-subunit alcohol dehydrogenase family)